MAEPPELWAFVVANSALVVAGGMLTGLSVRAYIRAGRRPFLLAALGFGTITFGGLVSVVYQIGLRGDYHLGGRELLALQTIETLLITTGLAIIFWSLTQY